MPEFSTPAPISAEIEISVGFVQLVASDRADTVVEVRPTDSSDESDVEAAQATRVDYADGTLTVRGPKKLFDFSRKSRSVDVVVELPTASRVNVDLSVGDCRTTGVLGESRFKTGVGHFHLDRIGQAKLATGGGNIVVGSVDGGVEARTGTGRIQIGDVTGAAIVKNANGHNELGAVGGKVEVFASNGDITVERAATTLDAKSANGTIRIGEVVRDTVNVHTATGDVEVGIAEGTAAWLDVKTSHGRVRNDLDSTAHEPAATENKVEVRVHTSFGDITVRRS